ncbi:MAG: hypothetical protein ACRYGR_10470 [Janthinobacterium lividum]
MVKNTFSKKFFFYSIVLIAFFNISSAFSSNERLINENFNQASRMTFSTGQNFTEILPEEIVKKIYDFMMPNHDSTLLLINKFSFRMLRQWQYSPNAMIDFRENDFFDFALDDLINKVENLSLKTFIFSRSCFSYHLVSTPDATSSDIFQIPKNVWRKRLGKVFYLPEKYWSKIPDSQIHTLHVSLLEDNTWRSVFNTYLCPDKLNRFLHIFDHKNLITTLDLSGNNIGVGVVHQLVQLKFVTSLNLAGNHVGNGGAALLANWVTLKKLNLKSNQITDQGGLDLSKNSTLTHLNIKYNLLIKASKKALKQNSTLQELKL